MTEQDAAETVRPTELLELAETLRGLGVPDEALQPVYAWIADMPTACAEHGIPGCLRGHADLSTPSGATS